MGNIATVMKKENLPINISPCPIIEASVELRCKFKVPADATIGMIFNLFYPEGYILNSLPITQIPEEIRKQDPNLKFKPTHRLEGNDGIIQVGNEVLIFSSPLSYPQWDKFETFIGIALRRIFMLNIIGEIVFLSLKYLNFFQLNIFEKIQLKILLNDLAVNYPATVFRTEIPKDEIINVLQIANNVHVANKLISADGSLIDITSVLKPGILINENNIFELINTLHLEEKTMFFSLLSQEFLNTLNPRYK